MSAPIPENEAERLAALRRYEVLDTPAEDAFDRIARIAAAYLKVPIALVSLVDESRQWFKARHGIDAPETPRDIAFCAHAIMEDRPLVVRNATLDPRFKDNPLVTGGPKVRFYAGAPLRTSDGFRLGTLCAIDSVAREFTDEEEAVLVDLAQLVVDELELRRAIKLARDQAGVESKTNQEIKDREARNRAIVETVVDGIITIDGRGMIETFNPAAERIFGYPAAETIGQNVRMLMPEPYRGEHDGYLTSYVEGGAAKVIGIGRQVTGRRKDGSTFPMELAVSEMEVGGQRMFTGIVRDVTERENNLQEIKDREARRRAILGTVVDGIITIDGRGTIDAFNPAAERIFGYTAAEVAGRNVNTLMPEPYRGEHDTYLKDYLDTGEAKVIGIGRQVTGRRKDGSTFPMELAVSEMEVGGNRMFTGIVRDITERKAAEEELLQSEARMSHLLTSSPVVIYTCEPSGDYAATYVSGNVRQLMGFEPSDFLNDPGFWASNIHPEDAPRVFGDIPQLFEHGAHTHEYRFRKPDGSYFWVRDELRLIRDADGKPREIIGSWSDVSQRKEVERLKSEFVSTVSHELRTPLTSIKGSLGLIKAGAVGEIPEAQRSMLDIAYKNSDRLVLLINDILDMEKIEAGKMDFTMAPIDVVSLVESAIEANKGYGDEHGVGFVLADGASRTMVQGDEARLMQVLSNLMSNAAKFSPEGEQVEVSVSGGGGVVRVAVADRGDGIPEAFRKRIFERFSQADSSDTRSQGGTGLGLSITRGIVERHGGTIGFETETGKGTTFFFELPEIAGQQAEPASPIDPVGRHRALICEGDPNVATVLQALLRKDGFATDIVHNAGEAKEKLAKNTYDVLTLDLGLPDQDGISLIQELRADEKTEALPIVVVSATVSEGDRELSGDAIGVIDWFQQPFNPHLLRQRIRDAVRGTADTKPHILHVEDDADILQVVSTLVGDTADITSVSSLREARSLLLSQSFNLVILDLMLPDGNGETLLPLLRNLTLPATPVIVFSAKEESRSLVQGVAAVLVKSRTSNEDLMAAIRSAINGNKARRRDGRRPAP